MATTFAYKVRDQSGKLIEGELDAEDATLVVGKLRQMGYTPIAVEAQNATKMKLKGDLKIPGMSARVKMKDVAVFSRQFAVMINSGLSLIRALAILADQTENKELARVVGEVRLDVERGVSLSAAISKHPNRLEEGVHELLAEWNGKRREAPLI